MKISVITPSFNQGPFVERTIRSILDQRGDFELEYLFIDGGSTDETIAIVRRYETRLTWVSEKDRGQSDAINKGFHRATGDILCWLNSDDTFELGALQAVAEAYARAPFAWCFGDCRNIDETDREVRRFIMRYKQRESRAYSFRRLLRRNFISQPATFFARSAWESVGDVDCTYDLAMDYDYILRHAKHADPVYIPRMLANFRWHGSSKSGRDYGPTAWLAFQMAQRHAEGRYRFDLLLHRLHYHALCTLYRFL